MIKTQKIVYLALAAMFCSGLPAQSQGRNATGQPNILIIIPDDLGWSDVGYNGSYIKTPHIDSLASTGVRLDQHYVMPTCTPTRVGLITGKYPSRYGVLGPDYGEVIYKGEPTMASILATNGYETFIAGKWHMGSPPHTPTAYGFQKSYGYLDGQIDPYTHEYKAGPNSWHRDDKLFREEGHATDLVTREAVRIVEGKGNRPFFLYVAYSVPHFPLDEPEQWTAPYDHLNLHPSRKQFAASVTHMDDGIGKIIDALERTGQRHNTLILFISDNGGQQAWQSDDEYRGKYADKPHIVLGNNYPLRGWKGELYEGGIRVPALANWLGRLGAGSNSDPIHVTDWLPTLCAVAQSEKSLKDLKLDGQNIWPQLTGGGQGGPAREMYWKTGQASAVRKGPWKLIVRRKDNQPELYNLENDFREMNDLSAKEAERTQALLSLMNEFQKDDRPRRGSPPPREKGR